MKLQETFGEDVNATVYDRVAKPAYRAKLIAWGFDPNSVIYHELLETTGKEAVAETLARYGQETDLRGALKKIHAPVKPTDEAMNCLVQGSKLAQAENDGFNVWKYYEDLSTADEPSAEELQAQIKKYFKRTIAKIIIDHLPEDRGRKM